MIKSKIAAIVAGALLLASCGKPLTTPEKTYPTYGLFNENSSKSKDMCYEVSVGNIVWSIILIETIIAPVYFIGFSLYNPIGPKGTSGNCGIDN